MRHLVFDKQMMKTMLCDDSVITMIEGIPSTDEAFLRTYIRESILASPGIDPSGMSYPLAYNGPIPKALFNEEYITGILGIEIPLNESRPFSPKFQKRVFEEHVLFEAFFDDFKKLGGDTKNAALALRYIMGDPSRLDQYAKIVKGDMQEAYKSVISFLEGLITGLSELPEKVTKAITKVLDWATKLVEKIKKLVKSAIAMTGWKGAMIISGALIGLGFIWKQLQPVAPQVMDGLTKVKEFVAGKVKESVGVLTRAPLLESASMLSLITEQEDGIMAKAAEKLKEIITPLLVKIKAMGAGFLKKMALETLSTALTGGIGTAFKALQSIFGGAKMVFAFLGDPLKRFIGKMKGDTDPKEEAEEATKGIDDPTSDASAKKPDPEAKKEALIRSYVSAKLVQEAYGSIGSGDPAQEVLDWAEEGNRVTVAGKNIWAGLGSRSGLHSYADEIIGDKWRKSGDRFTKKVMNMPAGTEMELKRFQSSSRGRGNWVTAGTVTTTGPIRSSGPGGEVPSAKRMREITKSLRMMDVSGKIKSVSRYVGEDEPFHGKNWEVVVGKERMIFPNTSGDSDYAQQEAGSWEVYEIY